MGQGPLTLASRCFVAEESSTPTGRKCPLRAAPVAAVYSHTVYGMQITGGSTSTWAEWERVRKAGAARESHVDLRRCCAVECRAGDMRHRAGPRGPCRLGPPGVVRQGCGKGRRPEAARESRACKDPGDFRIVGKPTRRLDTPDKVNGKAVFGLDVQLPGMLVALVARPPVFGGKVKSFNADKAKAVPGVRHVVQIPRGIAVIVADGFWPAKKGRTGSQEWSAGRRAARRPGQPHPAGRAVRRISQEAEGGRTQGRRRSRSLENGGEDIRGRVRPPVPGPRADGADQLCRRREGRPLRGVGGVRSSRAATATPRRQRPD